MTDPQIPVSTPVAPAPTPEPQLQGFNILTPLVKTGFAANPAVLFVTTYWKAIAFALLFLFAGYEWLRIDSLKNQVKVAETALQASKDELKNCRGEVDHLSDKVANAATESARLQSLLDGLKPQLDNIGRNTAATATKIMNQPTPKTCEEIQDYLIENQTDFGWKK